MKLQEFMSNYKRCEYKPSDSQFDSPFEDLSERIGETAHGHGDSLEDYFDKMFVSGLNVRSTLRNYKSLTENERGHLVSYHVRSGDPKEGVKDFGFVLRAFGKDYELFEELKNRWNLNYRVIGDDGDRQWVTKNVIAESRSRGRYEHSHIPVKKFKNKYKRLSEAEKNDALWRIGDLFMLDRDPLLLVNFPPLTGLDIMYQGHLTSVIKRACDYIPRKISEIGGSQILSDLRIRNKEKFVYENREIIIKIHESIEPAHLVMWHRLGRKAFDSWKHWDGPSMNTQLGEFIGLSKNEINVLNQAYEFAKQTEKEFRDAGKNQEAYGVNMDFELGFSNSLREGTILPWAQKIIDHFREGTIGGANYRILSGGNAA